MRKLKVMTVVGTRPEIIRMSRIIAKLDAHCEHRLVHSGQSFDYELNQIFFDELEVRRPDHFLGCAGSSPTQTIGRLLIAIDPVLERERPDAMLVLGDTNSCLAVVAAKRHKIPVFHLEAGNRCFDERVPEEINRRIIDHTADINLTYSSIAREYLLREGFPAGRVIKVGSPMYEVLHHYRPAIDASSALDRLDLEAGKYFLASSHREENIDQEPQFAALVRLLNTLAEDYQLPVVVSTHPRVRAKVTATDARFHPLVQLLKPLGFLDYVKLQIHARAVLSDSGTISEESSILNFPAVNLRDAHERPEAMEEAAVMLVGMDQDRVRQALAILAQQGRAGDRTLREVDDYRVPNVSDKVLRILHSYTSYVNRTVWRRLE